MVSLRFEHRLPFNARREPCAATPAQAELEHFGNNSRRSQRNHLPQSLETAIGNIGVKVKGIGQTGAGKGQTLLVFEVGNFFGEAKAETMIAPLFKSPFKK